MGSKGEFYTLKGYQMNSISPLTSAMEDYLEMIYRILLDNTVARISMVSENLHVTPSSASKMISQLKDSGYIMGEKYGYVTLTDLGHITGEYLFHRHYIINNFLCHLNGTASETEQSEKIEHFLTPQTVSNLARLTDKMDIIGFTFSAEK